MRGRKPIPTYLKVLRGNPGGRQLPEIEGHSQLPDKPDFLSPIAAEEWDRVTPELLSLKAVRPADRAVIVVYCELVSQWMDLVQILKQVTPSDAEWRKIVSTRNGIEVQIRAYASELGLTQAARQRLGAHQQNDGIDLLDKIMEMKNS